MLIVLVSIIIPVYNAGDVLSATIQSALDQTWSQKEIIVVDDASTDDSYAVAQRFAGEKVKLVRQSNAGAAVARNHGLSHARGELIQFLDAGDLLSENKIEKQVEALQNESNKLAVCNYIQFRKEEEVPSLVPTDQSRFIYSTDQPLDFLVSLLGSKGETNFIQTNCWLVPKSLIQKAGLWRSYRCPDDDGEFFARVILASEGIVSVPGVYNYFRVGPGANRLSGSSDPKYLMNTLLSIDLKHTYLTQKGENERIRKAVATQYLEFAVYNYPQQPILSAIAFRRYRQLGVKCNTPLLGGRMVEGLKRLMGWRSVRWLQYNVLRQ